MGSELYSLSQAREARKVIEKIYGQSEYALVIHYSCESFFKINDGVSPRIVCVCVRGLKHGGVKSFSLHHYAEKKKIPHPEIRLKYEELEKELLTDFFKYVKEHKNYKWMHWNMRNVNFGFQALEHRFEVLGGLPEIVPESSKVNLAALLQTIYGVKYCPDPVLVNLCNLNGLESEYFLSGKEESEAFDNEEYYKMYQSTTKKVDYISYIGTKALEGRLKSHSRWWKRYRLHPKLLVELWQSSWVFKVVASVATFLALARAAGFL